MSTSQKSNLAYRSPQRGKHRVSERLLLLPASEVVHLSSVSAVTMGNFCCWWPHSSSAGDQCPTGRLMLAPGPAPAWSDADTLPWLGPLAHTSGEFGFTFSLFFFLVIPQADRAAVTLGQRANTIAWQGKMDISR